MTPYTLIAIYCVPIVLACLLGGWIPQAFKLSHTRMQLAVSFVAGIILGVGLLHLLPHGVAALGGDLDQIMAWTMVGFLLMFFVERFLHFHHHDAPDDISAEPADEAADHDHDHHRHAEDAAMHHCDQHEHHADQFGLHVHSSTWIGTAIGMTLHSLIDGIALGGAVLVEWHNDGTGLVLAGFGVFLAVLMHKPFDSLTITMLMDAAKCSATKRHVMNGLYAAIVPIGAAIVMVTASHEHQGQVLGAVLGIAAGAFICIATSDLLPELQFHTHDRFKLSIALLVGVALAWAVIFFEHSGHGHLHSEDQPNSQPSVAEHHAHEDHDHPEIDSAGSAEH